MGRKGKVQEWCRLVWMGVEMWERGTFLKLFEADGMGEFRVSGSSFPRKWPSLEAVAKGGAPGHLPSP